jgi:hypothetical protein
MSEENISSQSKDETNDPKARFRQALEKKKQGRAVKGNNASGNSKIHGDQAGSGARKMFRRKSGSA